MILIPVGLWEKLQSSHVDKFKHVVQRRGRKEEQIDIISIKWRIPVFRSIQQFAVLRVSRVDARLFSFGCCKY